MKSAFLSDLVCTFPLGESKGNRTLKEPLRYRSALLSGQDDSPSSIDNPVIIEVPAGFSTDFASVPRGFWNVFPRDGVYTPAAVVHDWLYRRTNLPRSLCDAVFREAMEVCGTSAMKRWSMWLAVRLFGWAARSSKTGEE